MVNPPRKPTLSASELSSTVRSLVDRNYRGTNGGENSVMRPITISLPIWMIHRLEELALLNKRSNGSNRSVSALIRLALIDSGVLVGDQQ